MRWRLLIVSFAVVTLAVFSRTERKEVLAQKPPEAQLAILYACIDLKQPGNLPMSPGMILQSHLPRDENSGIGTIVGTYSGGELGGPEELGSRCGVSVSGTKEPSVFVVGCSATVDGKETQADRKLKLTVGQRCVLCLPPTAEPRFAFVFWVESIPGTAAK